MTYITTTLGLSEILVIISLYMQSYRHNIYIYVWKLNQTVLELDFSAIIFCSSLDGIWTHTIDTLQHHSLSFKTTQSHRIYIQTTNIFWHNAHKSKIYKYLTLWFSLVSNIFASSVSDAGYSERTWWRLFWVYLMKVILSVPDEGYSKRTWWRLFWAYLMRIILSVPDESYSERTWWRLFWAYLMKVILSEPDEGYSERTWWRLF